MIRRKIITEDDIDYQNRYPYYKGMPCFIDGLRINSDPYTNDFDKFGAFYWSDLQDYGCNIVKYFDRYRVQGSDPLSNYITLLDPMTFEEWKAINRQCSSVRLKNDILTVLNSNTWDNDWFF